jgi:hypothetical protein
MIITGDRIVIIAGTGEIVGIARTIIIVGMVDIHHGVMAVTTVDIMVVIMEITTVVTTVGEVIIPIIMEVGGILIVIMDIIGIIIPITILLQRIKIIMKLTEEKSITTVIVFPEVLQVHTQELQAETIVRL